MWLLLNKNKFASEDEMSTRQCQKYWKIENWRLIPAFLESSSDFMALSIIVLCPFPTSHKNIFANLMPFKEGRQSDSPSFLNLFSPYDWGSLLWILANDEIRVGSLSLHDISDKRTEVMFFVWRPWILEWSPDTGHLGNVYRHLRTASPKRETNGLRFDRKQDLFASLTSWSQRSVVKHIAAKIPYGKQVVHLSDPRNMMPYHKLGDYAGFDFLTHHLSTELHVCWFTNTAPGCGLQAEDVW